MLPKAHLTSHSRMSGSRWETTPWWLSGSWRSFLYSSVYSCHLFLVSSASVRSIPFPYFIVPIVAWNVPSVYLIFLKRSLVFPILLFSSIALHWSLRKAFLSLLLFFGTLHSDGYLSFSPFSAIYKASSVSHFALLHFFLRVMVLVITSCTVSRTSIHILQALCLSDLTPWIYFSLPLCDSEGCDCSHLDGPVVFPTFFKSVFGNKEFMIWATVSSWSCVCWLIELLHLWLQRI